MSLRNLLMRECAEQNPLLKVAFAVSHEPAFQSEAVCEAASFEVPNSFHMGTLLEKLQETETDCTRATFPEGENFFTNPSAPLAFPKSQSEASLSFQNRKEHSDIMMQGFIAPPVSPAESCDIEKESIQMLDSNFPLASNVLVELPKEMSSDTDHSIVREKDRNTSELYDFDCAWMEFDSNAASDDCYTYVDENPSSNAVDPFLEGLRLLSEGNIPSAAVSFEAATRQDPGNSQAWLYLGTTQAQNEHDKHAIAALKRCVTIEGNNKKALMALAASCANEGRTKEAVLAMVHWVKAHPSYESIVSESRIDDLLKSDSDLLWVRKPTVDAAVHLVKKVASLSEDPDVYCGLGILYNLVREYAAAAECFQKALEANSGDFLLWNRLGASLANGNRSKDAIKAYCNALVLSPGSIRTRFNLGISCLNMEAYREAAEHFLATLTLQSTARDAKGQVLKDSMSDAIWDALQLVVAVLNKRDLMKYVNDRDLGKLNAAFGL